MSENIPINIQIANRQYRIKTNPADEPIVQEKIKEINQKIMEFKQNFAGKDMQDYLAMTILWFATEQRNASEKTLPGSLQQELDQLERLLDNI